MTTFVFPISNIREVFLEKNKHLAAMMYTGGYPTISQHRFELVTHPG